MQLKPIVGERGVRYFEETAIQTVLVRVRRTRVRDGDGVDGTLAAAAFARFRAGADVIAVVTELRETPRRIERLFEQWKRLRGTVLLDAKSVAALAGDLGVAALPDENAMLLLLANQIRRILTNDRREGGSATRGSGSITFTVRRILKARQASIGGARGTESCSENSRSKREIW